MNWAEIKKGLYTFNGLYKDIVVFDTTEEDWYKYIEYINEKYEIFTWDKNNKMEYERVKYFWGKNVSNYILVFLVYINKMPIQAVINRADIIENTFHPKLIETEDDHRKILEYMRNISKILNKEVILAEEKFEGKRIEGNYVKIYRDATNYKLK
jgi:hypothetical protein